MQFLQQRQQAYTTQSRGTIHQENTTPKGPKCNGLKVDEIEKLRGLLFSLEKKKGFSSSTRYFSRS